MTAAPKKNQNKTAPFPSSYFFILKEVFNDKAGERWDELARAAFEKKDGQKAGCVLFRRFWRSVLEHQEFIRHPRVGNGLQDYFLEKLLDDSNLFHRKAEKAPLQQISPSLIREYTAELARFKTGVLEMDWTSLLHPLWKKHGYSPVTLEDVKGLELGAVSVWASERKKIKEKMLSAPAKEAAALIAGYFYRNGAGLFGRSRAFRWDVSRKGKGSLVPIEAVDPIRLENLVGYDEARQALLENIEGFVAGRGANNVLIYGERGTGKSSTVKAILNRYQDRGLRLVEISPAHLMEYHEVLGRLRGRREKFILFVDDLSFEENETAYKGLKALLEGGVESTPSNVILIATSNRRHLINEFFSEREEGVRQNSEVHGQDTIEEKLSLSDRFGLVVSFYTPNQETYLKIVESWAKVEGLKLPAEELKAKALLWARQNNGPSGRTAKQFINDLKGRV